MVTEKKYKCPVCGITMHIYRRRNGRNTQIIHDHYMNEIALILRNKGYEIELEYPLSLKNATEEEKYRKYFSEESCIKYSYEPQNKKERESEISKWRRVDIFAKKNNKVLLIEIEGTSDTYPEMAVKVDKMMEYDRKATIIIFSAEEFINEEYGNNKKLRKSNPMPKIIRI